MVTFNDYINGLEGQENLDPLTIAADLHRLHNDEISERDAAIQQRDSAIAERDTTLSTRDEELIRWKARNADLAMQIPGAAQPGNESEDRKIDGGTITPEDLFAKP